MRFFVPILSSFVLLLFFQNCGNIHLSVAKNSSANSTDGGDNSGAKIPFVMTVDTSITNGFDNIATFTSETPIYQIQFPQMDSFGSYNFTIDWGDGTKTNINGYSSTPIIHNYPTDSVKTIYDISISGEYSNFLGFYLDQNTWKTDAIKLIDVKQWGTNQWTSMMMMFSYCINLKSFSATDVPNLSQATTLANMFNEATFFNDDLSGWDISHVTSLYEMFINARSFNGDIGSWNTSSVVDMDGVFQAAQSFNQNLSQWDTSKVTRMEFMFGAASSFNQDISDWDTGRVTKMYGMFSGASSFNQNLSGWNVSAVTSHDNFSYGDSQWPVSSQPQFQN